MPFFKNQTGWKKAIIITTYYIGKAMGNVVVCRTGHSYAFCAATPLCNVSEQHLPSRCGVHPPKRQVALVMTSDKWNTGKVVSCQICPGFPAALPAPVGSLNSAQHVNMAELVFCMMTDTWLAPLLSI